MMEELTQRSTSADGLERIRDILFGDILAEIERRLARLDNSITTRANDVQHDARTRTDALEAHVRKELETITTHKTNEFGEVNKTLSEVRHQHRDAFLQFEQRLARIEERLDGAIARLERQTHEQLHVQTKSLLEEIGDLRSQVHAAIARDLDRDQDDLEHEQGEAQEGEHGTSAASH